MHGNILFIFSVAGYSSASPRLDGFPFLTFPTGQVFALTNELLTSRNLMWCLKRKIDGWQGLLGLMSLVGYPRVIVLRYLCEDMKGSWGFNIHIDSGKGVFCGHIIQFNDNIAQREKCSLSSLGIQSPIIALQANPYPFPHHETALPAQHNHKI